MTTNEKPVVLLIDDNEATCTLITAVLQREFVTDAVPDGADAIERLKTRRYAAILLDLRMPNIDGYAVLEHLKSTRPDLLPSVLVVTASLTQRELSRVHGYDVHGIVAKPFDVEELLAAVKRCANPAPPPGGAILNGAMLLFLADLIQKRLM